MKKVTEMIVFMNNGYNDYKGTMLNEERRNAYIS